ncbi:MAG: DNA polymerase III subunit delta [Acidocella sp. 20-57-95]|nr:MAG: DNA polymerase III subunit delta [Acidocella sp. 20-57-95]OYV61597.1 MAG: DNA polymerase III subunit delta [Acidocella sp. 21-58-7]HQT64247.1 DNA polymerase III subunit delta [Acidocella sp.]HQU04673.1 DNA polymerase III subunit delta [Acidocella sp.]
MKIDAGRVEAFLKNPGTANIVLIYGPDAGLVAERALTLVKAVIGNTDDAFNYAELSEPSRLLEEATAASLMGGRRAVRLRDAGESAVKQVEALLKTSSDTLVVLEGGDLTPKSKLRALAEKSPTMACIACYAVDAARLPRVLSERLRALGVGIDTDAAAWAGLNMAGEEGVIRQNVELLYLYAGEGGRLSLADVQAALADGGETSMQDAIDATLTGDTAGTDRALALAFDAGESPVAVVRILLGELMRLRVMAAQISPGSSISDAVSAMRPPVFFKRVPVVTKALGLWSVAALTEAIKAALTAEAACKTTHVPDTAYCRQMMLGLASRARNAGRR